MRTLFMGTPDFGLGCLDVLIEKTEVVGVVSQPDKPKGRGHMLMPTPVKAHAQEKGIAVYQPEKLKNEAFLPTLKELDPELIVVVAYGRILPDYILDYPKFGCINVHASLLPKLRGAAPIQRSIINGDTVTGVTTMMMDSGLDTGDMLMKCEVPISKDETGGGLFEKLSVAGAELLEKTLCALEDGNLVRTKQNHDEHTYAPMLDKETGHVDWNKSAKAVYDLVRALNPIPLAYTKMDGKGIKLIKVSYSDETNLKPGVLGEYDKQKGIPVGTADGTVYIEQLKPEGKGAMSVHDYVRGHSCPAGTILE